LRARAGYAISNFLIYGTGGVAFGELQGQTIGLLSENHTNVGWTAGVGLEAGFAANWSAKVEYLFVDLASSTFTLTGTSNGLSASLFRMGVNYHF
jgi:outer membrane immunogenic protein